MPVLASDGGSGDSLLLPSDTITNGRSFVHEVNFREVDINSLACQVGSVAFRNGVTLSMGDFVSDRHGGLYGAQVETSDFARYDRVSSIHARNMEPVRIFVGEAVEQQVIRVPA
ncbi:hypothetical protein [Burkholderia aenigmatica]|uniref:hypothetical protein n=1 Tax=Burkholderia aenigmatica TaxID=2015348 RepID=UPI001581BE49|nr:hypothetical protein [Burkholderia aenigmatica]